MKTMLVLLSMVGFSTSAWAQDASQSTGTASGNALRVGIQVDGAKITGDAADAFGFGFGFGARAGYDLHFGNVLVTPELAINWNRWAVNDVTGQGADLGSAWILGVMPGARAGYALGTVTPYLQLHFGLDHGSGSGSNAMSSDKFGIDVGAGADIALKSASIGPFVSYNMAFTDPSTTNWITFGVGGSLGL
jgi:hypothetical protein